MKKTITILAALVLFMLITAIPAGAASDSITISSAIVKAVPGETNVDVAISIENNSGLYSLILNVEYDSSLTLIKAVKGTALSSMNLMAPAENELLDDPVNPIGLLWDAMEPDATNGLIVTLTFSVSSEASGSCPIKLSYDPQNTFDASFATPEINLVNGGINVAVNAKIGDVNQDGDVNATDRMILARYLAGWEGYEEKIKSMEAADIDGNGTVEAKDRMLLARFLAGWEGYAKYFPSVVSDR